MIRVWTDGACSGNPGPGGWGVVIEGPGHTLEISGGVSHTTNQEMELRAAIEAFKRLKPGQIVEVVSDSQYVVSGMTDWILKWKKRGWKTSSKKPVVRREMWEELDGLAQQHEITWQWVPGDGSNDGNARADTLAREAIPIG